MLVVKIVRGSPGEGILKEGDVLFSVEGHPVAGDGTVEFRDRERTSVSYYIQAHQVGEPMTAEILREGRPQTVTITLSRPLEKDWLVPLEQYDVRPRYLVYGGLVFCPLTANFLKSWGPNWFDAAPEDLVSVLGFNYVTDERDEVVLLQKVLAADVNQGYQDFNNWTIAEVNGKKVKSLRDLAQIIEAAKSDPFITLTSKYGQQIVLEPKHAEESQATILETYRIPSDRSDDLKDTGAAAKP